MRLVLASASPRRRELLQQAGFAFELQVAGIDETRRTGESPADYVRRLALEKAQAVSAALTPGSENPEPGKPDFLEHPIDPVDAVDAAECVVLGADTTVVLAGEVLNKPADRAEAERMLRALAGRTHQVLTGVAVVCSQCVLTHVEATDVMFRELSEDELQTYLDSGDALDKAGAYGIQGYAARWIPRIEGDYFNVVGLPIAAVVKMLGQCKGSDAVERDPDYVL